LAKFDQPQKSFVGSMRIQGGKSLGEDFWAAGFSASARIGTEILPSPDLACNSPNLGPPVQHLVQDWTLRFIILENEIAWDRKGGDACQALLSEEVEYSLSGPELHLKFEKMGRNRPLQRWLKLPTCTGRCHHLLNTFRAPRKPEKRSIIVQKVSI